jgi:hypothetical protein
VAAGSNVDPGAATAGHVGYALQTTIDPTALLH